MSKRSIVIACIVLAICAGTAIWLRSPRTEERKPQKTTNVAKPKAAKPEVKKPSAYAVAVDRTASRNDRLLAISRLSNELSVNETRGLRKLVKTRGEDPTIRNDAFIKLQEQKLHSQKGLIYDMVASCEDKKEDATWRDFAIQFLAGAYDTADAKERKLAVDTLFKAAEDKDCSEAATALLTLQRISEIDPAIKARLAELNRTRLDAEDDTVMRTAAINVAIDSRDESILPRCRKVAANSGAQSRERLSSIGALGQLGDSTDLPRLEVLTKDGDPRVRRVAGYQLRALKKRLKL